VNTVLNLRILQKAEKISSPAGRLLVAQEGLCCVKLFNYLFPGTVTRNSERRASVSLLLFFFLFFFASSFY
jgi:hypothetical protein